jgi:UPF0755 protein
MSNPHPPSRKDTCLFILIILIGLIIISTIVVPKFIITKAEQIYGPASAQLSFRQHVYLSALLVFQSNDLTQPLKPGGSEVSLTINPGESVPSITGKLWEAGLISNPGAFRSYLQYSGLDISLKAGEYELSPSMTPLEIANAIQSSISADVTLTILPGWRVEEIASSLATSGFNIPSEEFMRAVRSHPEGYSFSVCLKEDSLEGYLFPGSYTMPRESTIDGLFPLILMNFKSQVTGELRTGFTTQGLDLCQAVTLASIVQREAVLEEEMPLIASVFFNRLNSGAELASDPTVQYALGFNQDQGTWWTNPLSLQDLQVDSPFNTYIYKGLPPGPISNPGLAALRAVAFPAQTSYYYFRAACDGSGRHLFAETYAEHLANECP